jgi:glutamyl-tRNA reductase
MVRTLSHKRPGRCLSVSQALLVSAPSSLRPTFRPEPRNIPVTADIEDGHEPRPLDLYGLEFSLETASLDALDAVARDFDRNRLAEWFDLRTETEEVALLTTCHRVELLLVSRSAQEVERWKSILPGEPSSWRPRCGREVVRHLFRVAAGRESLAVGEREVRLQVRGAGSTTLSRHPRPLLRELFRRAAEAADEVSPSVPASCSIAAVASTRVLELAGRSFPRVLVLGAGAVGRQVAELLAPAARVTLIYRRSPPDERFLRSTGARAARIETLSEELAVSDAVITAAKSGDRCLGPADLPRDHPLVLVDLGVPRNIDPAVRGTPNLRLIDLEGLRSYAQSIASSALDSVALDALADRFWERLQTLTLEPWIDAIRRSVEAVRASELANARTFLGSLSPEQEVAIERLTRRLVARILLSPTERLRLVPPGADGDRMRRFALELLRPAPLDP